MGQPNGTRDALLDGAAALFVTVVIELNVWSYREFFGTHIAGPRWLTAALPLLLGLPLLLRRRFPLVVVSLIMLGTAAQAIASSETAEGLEYVVAFALGLYSVAAFSTRRRALAGLAIFVAGYVVFAVEDQNVRSGGIGQGWAGAFWGLFGLAFWLIGVFVHSRRETTAFALEATRIERAAETAVAEERSRIARELHDVIAHSVSVIGLQAGAAERVLARDPERAREPLRAIQNSARESVLELSRLIGILRQDAEPTALAPQPRLAALELLLEQVRGAGLEVELRIEGVAEPMPPGVELSAYRIVQEALTNVLKHAAATRAEVQLRYEDRSLELEVIDNGAGAGANGTGHGLIGMRERAALYGGTVIAGSRPGGGFSVSAVLPREAAEQ